MRTDTEKQRRLGVTVPLNQVPLDELAGYCTRLEALGYDDLWSEEATSMDGITPLAIAAAVTEEVRLVTGVINPYTRGRALLAQTAAALAEASGGRFVLGLGSSSKVVVESFNGGTLEAPSETMRQSIAYLKAAFAGERVDGGFRLERPPERPVPIVLAALRGEMLRLAASETSGAFSNFLPVSGVGRVVSAFDAPDRELACRVFAFVGPEDDALARARRLFAAYGSAPFYTRFFRWLGWSEQIDPMAQAWAAGDRKAALDLVPDDLVREIFLVGDLDAQGERVEALFEAGIDSVVLALYGDRADVDAALPVFARLKR